MPCNLESMVWKICILSIAGDTGDGPIEKILRDRPLTPEFASVLHLVLIVSHILLPFPPIVQPLMDPCVIIPVTTPLSQRLRLQLFYVFVLIKSPEVSHVLKLG